MRVVLAIIVAAAAVTAHAGGFFKWTDPVSGEAVYSNDPPPAAIKKVEEKKLVPSSIQTSNLPYGVQQAVQRNPIVLYASNCGEFCDSARAYLSKRGLPYVERDPQQPGDAEQYRKAASGGNEVPLLTVGNQVVRGFDHGEYDSLLDAAGYPKTPLTSLGIKTPVKPRAPVAATLQPETKPEVHYVGTLAMRPFAPF